MTVTAGLATTVGTSVQSGDLAARRLAVIDSDWRRHCIRRTSGTATSRSDRRGFSRWMSETGRKFLSVFLRTPVHRAISSGAIATNRQASAGAPQKSRLAFLPAPGDLPETSSPFRKNISLRGLLETPLVIPPSRLEERGVSIVMNVGCGMRWTRWRRKTSDA